MRVLRAPSLVLVVAVVAVVGAGGAGCSEDSGCELAFVVDAAPCPVDACVIDFGAVSPNLSETLRLSWSGACNGDEIFDVPTIDDGGDVFRIGSTASFLGERGDEGFAFVSATPVDDQPAHGTLALPPRSIALVVNGD